MQPCRRTCGSIGGYRRAEQMETSGGRHRDRPGDDADRRRRGSGGEPRSAGAARHDLSRRYDLGRPDHRPRVPCAYGEPCVGLRRPAGAGGQGGAAHAASRPAGAGQCDPRSLYGQSGQGLARGVRERRADHHHPGDRAAERRGGRCRYPAQSRQRHNHPGNRGARTAPFAWRCNDPAGPPRCARCV